MKICIHCGHHFSEPSNRYNKRWSDSDDSEQFCPNCGSPDFEDAGHCIKCGEFVPEDEMVGSICKACVMRAMTVENAYAYGQRNTPEDEINDFVVHAWTPRQASEELLKSCTPEDARRYISDDIYDFSEWLEGQEE